MTRRKSEPSHRKRKENGHCPGFILGEAQLGSLTDIYFAYVMDPLDSEVEQNRLL